MPRYRPRSSSLLLSNLKTFLAIFSVSTVLYGVGGFSPCVRKRGVNLRQVEVIPVVRNDDVGVVYQLPDLLNERLVVLAVTLVPREVIQAYDLYLLIS